MRTICGTILAATAVALSAHGALDVRDFGAKGDGTVSFTLAPNAFIYIETRFSNQQGEK